MAEVDWKWIERMKCSMTSMFFSVCCLLPPMTAREETVLEPCSDDSVLSPNTAAAHDLASFCSSHKTMLECQLSLQCVVFLCTRKLFGMRDVVRLRWRSVSKVTIGSISIH